MPFVAFSVVMAHRLFPDVLHGIWGKVAPPSKLSGFWASTPHFNASTVPDEGAFVTLASGNVNVGTMEEELGTKVPSGKFAARANEGPRVGL